MNTARTAWWPVPGVMAFVLLVVHVPNGSAQVFFRDNFDAYGNQAEFDGVWQTYGGLPVGHLDCTGTACASPPCSFFHPANPGYNRYHVFPAATPEWDDPIVWRFNFYDDGGPNKRMVCSLLTSPNWNSSTDKWIDFGCYGSSSYTHYCMRTVNLSGPNWTVYPHIERSVGWHQMRVEIEPRFVRFWIDDPWAYYEIAINAQGVEFTTVACGGPSNLYSAAGGAWYDDIDIQQGIGPGVPPVYVKPILVNGRTEVNVTSVDPSAVYVKVYKNATTLIGMNDTLSGASTVEVTVEPLVSGDMISATQGIPWYPGGPVAEGCVPSSGWIVDDCRQIPGVSITGLVDAGRSSVFVTGVDSTAEAVKVYAYDPRTETTSLIGTNAAPGSESLVQVNVSPALVEGQVIRATQTLLGLEGCVPTSGGRRVTAPGIIEDFEDAVIIQDHPAPGISRAWYDVSFQSYTVVESSTMFGSNCINIRDHGWTNGAYVIYENIIPADGTYHLQLDMLIDEYEGCDYDFYNRYQLGVIVNGVHRDASAGIVPSITSPIGSYPCLTPNRDGVGATEPVKVYVGTFTANAGDSVLLAFSTDVNGYVRSKTATPAGYVGMKVDNIRLAETPIWSVPPVRVIPTAATPLVAGRTQVTVGPYFDVNATGVKVYADGALIGSQSPVVSPVVDVLPLVAGQRLQAAQVVWGVEGYTCPGDGPVVGSGNTPIQIALGIRETGQTSGTIGEDGGTDGTVEWVGATSQTGGAPAGKTLYPGGQWQTVTFSSSRTGGSDPVTAFTGDGIISGAYGTLEHIAFTIEVPYNTGPYLIYIDEIMNGSTLLTGFEGFIAGESVMFRNPTFSGTTNLNLLSYPDAAQVDASHGDDGTSQSLRVEFQFFDDQLTRWLRLTTWDSLGEPDMPLQNPLIDLDQPITMKLLLLSSRACNDLPEDLDGDGDVDADDFFIFVNSFNRSSSHPDFQECADYNWDGTVDAADYDLWLAGYRAYLQIPDAPAPLEVLGDFQRDGHVDGLDLIHFMDCASGPGLAPPPAGCADADLDRDDDVDQDDFAILQRCLTGLDAPINLGCRQ